MTLLTSIEAAERLRICERTLRKARQRGEIAYIAVSDRRVAYTVEDCDAYIESRRRRDEKCPSTKTLGRRIGNTTSSTRSGGFMARLEKLRAGKSA